MHEPNVHRAILLVILIFGGAIGWSYHSAIAIQGELAVTTFPEGATVFIDGRDYGQTPTTVEQIPLGNRRVTLAKEGYRAHDSLMHFSPRVTRTLEIYLATSEVLIHDVFESPGNVAGRIIFMPPFVYMVSTDGHLIAFDTTEERVIWDVGPNDELVLRSPIVHGDSIFFASLRGNLYGYNRFSGEPLWQAKQGERVNAMIGLASGVLVQRGTRGISSLTPLGSEEWSMAFDEDILTLTSQNDLVHVIVVTQSGKIVRLDGENGQDEVIGSVGVSGEIVGAFESNGAMLFETSEGSIFIWEPDTSETVRVDATIKEMGLVRIIDDLLFIGDSSGELWAIDRNGGNVIWRTNLHYTATELAHSDNRLIVGCDDGSVFLVGKITGEVESRIFFGGRIGGLQWWDGDLLVSNQRGQISRVVLP